MTYNQTMINQMNAIIHFFPEEDKRRLPYKLVRFFSQNATCPPEEAVDMSLPLEKQDLDDETVLMLYFINNLAKQSSRRKFL